jgi:ubiquitin carboxyl-terminal hydrolase 22/27/51
MGQTCFMSVIVQSLIHNPFIRNFYMSEGHKKEECERDTCTACSLDTMFNEFYGEEKREGYGAVLLLQACWKECLAQNNSLMGYAQQDAHEFFGFIHNSLHTAIMDEDDSQPIRSAKKCPCIIHMTFGGTFKSTVTCSKCNEDSVALDPFMDLSLDIRSAPVVKKKKLALINGTSTTKEIPPMDLSECLDRFTSEETLSADSYTCRYCNSSQEAKKKLALSRCPWVLPIHLKRFSHSKTLKESTKIETRIRFPLSLDLRPYTTSSSAKSKAKPEPASEDDSEDDEREVVKDKSDAPDPPLEPIYELSSVVVHKGKIDTGHYISYSRQGGEWFRFDDSMVVQVDVKEVLQAEAYMLFYVVAKV